MSVIAGDVNSVDMCNWKLRPHATGMSDCFKNKISYLQ